MKLKSMTATSKSSTVEANDKVFGQKANPTLLAQAVRVYLSNLRQGSSKVKTRSAVKRTKSKWYRQKGTGNARHGSRNAPIFVGGGVAHGPTGQENWTKSLNRNMKQQALRVALSMQTENIVVTDNLSSLKGKTAEAAALFEKMFGELNKILVVLDEDGALVRRSVNNMPEILTVSAAELNALQVASADTIVLSKKSLSMLEARLSGEKAKQVKEVKEAKETKKEEKPAKKAAAKKTAAKKTKKTTKK